VSAQQSPLPDDRPDAAPPAEPATPSGTSTAPEPTTGAGPTTAVGPTSTEGTASPGEVEIEDVVDPATVRRAPRYRAFFTAGILLGAVLGLGVGGAWLQSGASQGVFKPGVYFTVILVTCTALGAAVAGLWAVLADRRSLRRR